MLANGLTKPLSAQKHKEFIKMLDLTDISSIIQLSNAGGVC